MVEIRVESLWKVFGRRRDDAIELSKDGKNREEIRDETGATVALADVDFEVKEGELFVLMGLSGCGKSTLVRCVNRLHDPTRGKVWIGDTDVTALKGTQLRRFRRKQIGMVFQHVALLPHRTVLDNVAYGLEVQKVPQKERRERAMKQLEAVQLANWAHESPSSLSGGMRQRVGVARALTIEPEILLMDEPFSALDPLIRTSMQEDLEQLRERVKKTILFVTHDLDEALTLGDRIAIMREGRIVSLGSPSDIAVEPDDEYVERFVQGVNRARVLKAEDVMRAPLLKLKSDDSPQLVLRRMENHGFESGFVVHRNGKFAGVVTMDRLLEGMKRGEETIETLVKQHHAVAPEAIVEEIVRLSLEHRTTVAVVDSDGVLKGIVRQKDLLPAFVDIKTATANAGEEAGPSSAGASMEP